MWEPGVVFHGSVVQLRSTTSDDRAALVAIRSTPEVRHRWRGDDLAAEFDEDLTDTEVVRLTIENADGIWADGLLMKLLADER